MGAVSPITRPRTWEVSRVGIPYAGSGYVGRVQRNLEVHVAEKTGTTPVVGETVTNFELPDEQGRPFNLARELEGGPIVLVFYRGDW